MKKIIQTKEAPAAIGTYSQAVQTGNTVYASGQIPLDPITMQMVEGEFKLHVQQVFRNLQAVAKAAGGNLSDIVKLNIYLLDRQQFPMVNEVMAEFLAEPFPARAVIAVSALPKNAVVEMDAILYIV